MTALNESSVGGGMRVRIRYRPRGAHTLEANQGRYPHGAAVPLVGSPCILYLSGRLPNPARLVSDSVKDIPYRNARS